MPETLRPDLDPDLVELVKALARATAARNLTRARAIVDQLPAKVAADPVSPAD